MMLVIFDRQSAHTGDREVVPSSCLKSVEPLMALNACLLYCGGIRGRYELSLPRDLLTVQKISLARQELSSQRRCQSQSIIFDPSLSIASQ